MKIKEEKKHTCYTLEKEHGRWRAEEGRGGCKANVERRV